jgi:fructose-1,6-bisphosphatase/sedoheptulose 1,7-bisphosphatase-like protein
MAEPDKSPDEQDIDERLMAESLKLLQEIDALMNRARIIILDRERLTAVIKEKKDAGEK